MKKQLLTVSAIAIGIAALTMSIVNTGGQKKMAYFDYNKVYNDCELKKELEKDLEKVVSARKSELDSMQLELSLMSNRVQAGSASQDELNQFEDMKGRYLTYQGRYEEENIRLKEQYFAQIRSKINEMSQEYAEDNGYDYLFSAVGDGSLMYGRETEEITDEVLEYVNKK